MVAPTTFVTFYAITVKVRLIFFDWLLLMYSFQLTPGLFFFQPRSTIPALAELSFTVCDRELLTYDLDLRT